MLQVLAQRVASSISIASNLASAWGFRKFRFMIRDQD